MTSVVSTLRTPTSWQNPSSSTLTPAESTSVSSVRLPTPVIIAAPGPHRVADAGPRRARVAAHVDDVGPLVAVPPRLGQQFLAGQARGVVDLGEDRDVVGPVVRRPRRARLEELRQVAQVRGAA